MITWTVRLRSKPDTIDQWIAVARELTETSNRMDAGCVVYICLQHLDDPQEFTWYEQWADMPTLRAHVDRINPLLGGPPRPGEWTAPRLFEVLESREQLTWHEFQENDPHLRDWFAPGLSQLVYTTVKPGHAAGMAGSTVRPPASSRRPRTPCTQARCAQPAAPVYHVQPPRPTRPSRLYTSAAFTYGSTP